jgi:hypothetical protein
MDVDVAVGGEEENVFVFALGCAVSYVQGFSDVVISAKGRRGNGKQAANSEGGGGRRWNGDAEGIPSG